ncbi:MAG: pilus assembly protein [Steroidobacteraceae bacterium]
MNSSNWTLKRRIVPMLMSAALTVLLGWSLPVTAAAPPVPVSQVPLTIAIPAHPQILVAVANSESMDGNLSGAIMTGSGSLGASYSALQASSSPLNYTIPAGFTPPLNAGGGGAAPYTVASGANLVDNSPSRLNVAKAGITAILNGYITSADFGLIDYDISGNGVYTTWVYEMSQNGGFTFTSVPAVSGQVPNPCYNVNISLANPVSADCANLNTFYAAQNILTQPYMNIGASSDYPSINDVLYDETYWGQDAVCVVHDGPNPANPYPPNFTLADFNAGGFSVTESYNRSVNPCATTTGPTNAGYVPYSTQVMYIQRGFGYNANQAPNDGTVVVPMTTAGATPTAASTSAALAAFTPYLQPETNNTGTSEIKAAAVQSPMAGLIKQANTYFATNPATSNGCTATRYVLLLTDGLPTFDLNGNSWPPLGSAAATGYGVTATFNADGSLAATNDQALTDAIAQLTALNAAGIKTYIVGLGAGVNPTLNPTAAATLTAMAVAGGTGSYFAATDPVTLANDLQSILGSILAATQSVASVAVNSTGLSTNSVVYQSQFLSSDTLQDWTGNLYAYPVSSTGVVDTVPADAIWSAATQLDAQNWDTGRMIATWDPVALAGTPFRWNTSTTAASGIASSTTLGQDLTTFLPDPSGQDVLQFLRGSSAKEVRNGGQFRNRTHKLGDIVFSNPVYVGAPSANNLAPSYLSFAFSQASRPPVVYVGADDGMLHAFDAVTGNERFAYIPTGVYGNLINLVSPYYNSRHLFFVDGSPKAADVQFSDVSWHTVLLGTEGAGGKSVFALDVSNPTTITSETALASAVLWDFTDTDMGLSYANPAIANYGTGQLVFLGNGYDSTNEKPFLYALNPQTGAIYTNGGGTAKIDLCAAVPTACNLALPNGLSSAIAVNSSGQAAASANIVYAGDLQGNLWRVDVSNTNPSLWTVSVLLQARDPSGNPQPITTAPVATLNPRYPQIPGSMVFVGTGQLLGVPDLSTTQVQTIYGVYDPTTPYATPLSRTAGGLVQQVLSSATIGATEVAVVTGNAVTIPTNKGWYIDLTLNSGERVVNSPLLKSGALVVTSTQPASSPCTTGGSSFLYVINYATGSAFPSPQFTVNGNSNLNSGNTVTNGSQGPTDSVVPIGTRLGSGFYANATIVNTGTCSGAGCAGSPPPGYYYVYNCPESGTACTPRLMKGSLKHRIAWWEVRQ